MTRWKRTGWFMKSETTVCIQPAQRTWPIGLLSASTRDGLVLSCGGRARYLSRRPAGDLAC